MRCNVPWDALNKGLTVWHLPWSEGYFSTTMLGTFNLLRMRDSDMPTGPEPMMHTSVLKFLAENPLLEWETKSDLASASFFIIYFLTTHA